MKLLSDICKDMKPKLAKKSQQLLLMLQNCLQLNPYFRMTANECLNAKLFDSVRDPVKERILLCLKQKKMQMACRSKTW